MSHIDLSDKAVDQLPGTLLAVPFFRDERPPMGPAAIIDWRMNGALSQLLKEGDIDGHWGEQLILPAGSKLPNTWVLFFGAGEGGSLHEGSSAATLIESMASSCFAAGYDDIAMALPPTLSSTLAIVVEAVEKAKATHQLQDIHCEVGFYPSQHQ